MRGDLSNDGKKAAEQAAKKKNLPLLREQSGQH
jgi:hypothetical protein